MVTTGGLHALILKDFECMIIKLNVNQSTNKCIVFVVVIRPVLGRKCYTDRFLCNFLVKVLRCKV